MPHQDLEVLDRQLAQLGAVPTAAALSEMVRRYVGEQVTASNADALLDALGQGLPAPPQLQPTLVGADAPGSSDVALEQRRAGGASRAPQQAAVDEAAEDGAQESSEAMDEPREAARKEAPRSSRPPRRARMPWESEPPKESLAAAEPAAEVPELPAPSADLQALFSDVIEDEGPRILSVMPAEAPVQEPRRRHDTIEQMAPVSARLAPMSALDLGDLGDSAIPKDARVPSEATARASEAPEVSVGGGEDDEFEILVDDEMLEFDEDEDEDGAS